MTLVRNRTTRKYEADLRSSTGPVPRLHVSLRTKVKSEGDDRHAAVKALYKEGNEKLITGSQKAKDLRRSGDARVPGEAAVRDAAAVRRLAYYR
jgi:hypothetical protein